MYSYSSFSIPDQFVCSSGYIDKSFLTVIDSASLILLFFVIWFLPLYFYNRKSLLLKFIWIFIWGFLLNFYITIIQQSVSWGTPNCYQGKNTDILNSINITFFDIADIYILLIQPLLLVLILILASITITKFIIKKIKL